MTRRSRIFAAICGIAAAASVAIFIGEIMEYEYPYALTILQVSNARTGTGELAADVIAQTLHVRRPQLNWHRCSFCKSFDKTLPPGMIRVQVSIISGDNHVFAFDPRSRVLYPEDDRTRGAFPMMPPVRTVGHVSN
jgi:hypothetical protein